MKGFTYIFGSQHYDLKRKGKYIVCSKEPKALTYYAVPDDGQLRHRDIARQFGLSDEDVLGGGDYDFKDGCIVMKLFSTQYRGVPREVAGSIGCILAERIGYHDGHIDYGMKLQDVSDALAKHPFWKEQGFV